MPPRELVEVIRQVHTGKKRVPPEVAAHLAEHMSDEELTGREINVLRHIAGGNRNRDIAEQLFISEETVKVHIKHIMEASGCDRCPPRHHPTVIRLIVSDNTIVL